MKAMLAIIVVICIITVYLLNSQYFLQTRKYVDFNKHMRMLWSDHVVWTRQVIIDAVNKDPMLSASKDRLMRNSVDMAQVVKTYYGPDAAKKAKELLDEHLLIAVNLVGTAIKGGDIADLNAMWRRNAEEIAKFFTAAGAYSAAAGGDMSLLDMMYMHLDLTKQEAVEIINKGALPVTFDKIYANAMDMAEGFSAGIMSKFWYKFVL